MNNYLEILKKNGKSFYWAGQLLPKKYLIRCAELYSFCRLLDDIADSRIKTDNLIKLKNILDLIKKDDYHKLKKLTNLDFVEFHLSYTDLEIQLDQIFTSKEKIGLAVHSPELFSGDHIMDLASDDKHYREHSISELSRVCQITRELKKYFPLTKKPVIVINAGGFSTTNFLDEAIKNDLYETVGKSIAEVNQDGIEIIIQTMPPFPWHFGGQRFQNLFIGAPSSAGNDSSGSGTLHLFDPSNTTFVKHFIFRGSSYQENDAACDSFIAGYGNTTSAIDAVQFKFVSGNIDSGVIKLYGVN